jgi:hypothetical protein
MTQFLNNRDYNETDVSEDSAESVNVFPENPKNSRMVFKLPEKCLYVFYGTWLPMCGGGTTSDTEVENQMFSENGVALISEAGDPLVGE